MPVTITLEQLKVLKACPRILNSLVATYGTSATFQTPEELSVAVFNSKQVDWCYKHLLTLKNRDTYEAAVKPLLDTYQAAEKPLRDTYLAARKPLLDTYEAARKPLWDTYQAAKKPLLDTYLANTKPLLDTYQAARKPLLDTYEAATALIFATIYFEQEKK